MEGNLEQEQPRPSPVQRIIRGARSWLLASPRHVGYAVVLGALLLTVPFGGLAAAPEEELPVVAAGEPVTFAPWEVTLEKAIWGPDLGGSFGPSLADDGRQHVLILGTLRTAPGVTETLSTVELNGSLAVRPEEGSDLVLADSYGTPLEDGGLPRVGAVFSREPTPQALNAVPPGLTYDIVIALTTGPGELPEHLEVELLTKTQRLSSLEDRQIWTDEEPSAQILVPTEPSGPVFENVWSLVP